jgi:hypothetical protein
MLTIRQFSKLLAFVLWTAIESPSSLTLARVLPREAAYYFTPRDDHDDDDDHDGRDSDDDSDNDSDSGDEHEHDHDQDEVGSAGGSGLNTGATIAIVVVIGRCYYFTFFNIYSLISNSIASGSCSTHYYILMVALPTDTQGP